MKTFVWPILCILLIAIGVFFFFQLNSKSAFFYNDKVFAAFQGKIELESKLKAEQARNKASLDSLALLITSGRAELQGIYNQTAELANIREQQLTEKYTSDIWKFINDKATEYGKEKNYEFIFGAVGDGSLMYAHEKNDITAEFIEYLNSRYSKGP
jgi:Skp family chaperone for outer membrane proteins